MRTSTLFAILAVLLGTAVEARAAREAGSIRLRPRAQVAGERITLGDLGRLDGEAVEFDGIDLGVAPEAGSTRRIAGASILARLQDAGMDDERIRYSIPSSVRVRRAHQEIHPEEIRFHIEKSAVDWLEAGDAIESIESPVRLRVPLGAYAIRVRTPRAVGRHAHEADIEIEQEGQVVARGEARLRISSRRPVVVARRAVARGAMLTEEDIRVEKREVRGLPSSVLNHPDEVLGRLASVSLSPGAVLTARKIEVPLLVERGDLVRVAIENGGMRLTVPAEALDSAGLGERVRLINPTSGREFSAEVIAHGKARVHY